MKNTDKPYKVTLTKLIDAKDEASALGLFYDIVADAGFGSFDIDINTDPVLRSMTHCAGDDPEARDKAETAINDANQERAARGVFVLRHYAQEVLGEGGDGGDQDTLTDLLADLRHYAATDLNFDDAVRISENHFEAEVAEEKSVV